MVSRREFLEGAGIGGLGAVGALRPPLGDYNEDMELTLLHDTHFHGRFDNLFVAEQNVANYFGLMDRIAGDREAVLKLGNGDDLASSVLSSVFQGEHVVDALNAGGLHYDTYGNHDFDMGPGTLRKRVAASDFTWVSANVLDRRTGDAFAAEQGAERYVVTEVETGGLGPSVSVGITGLITPEAPEITSMGENAMVMDPVGATRETVRQMQRDGAEVTVVLSHLANTTAREVARNTNHVDLIVGDHAASVREDPVEVGGTTLSFVGDQFEYIGQLDLQLSGRRKEIDEVEFTLHSVADAVEGTGERAIDPAFQGTDVAGVMNRYMSELSDELDVVVGQTEAPIDTRESVVRAQEAAIGNYIADAEREFADADLGLMNGGGIRTDTLYFEDASPDNPRDVTKRLVFGMLPFGNTVVSIEVTGEAVVQALENGVSKVEDGAGRFPQVSGLAFTWDPSADPGNRIVEVTVGGEPIDRSATFTLATNNFVASGGDGYDEFTDAPRLIDANAGPLLAQHIVNSIEADSPISPEVEGRITEVGDGGGRVVRSIPAPGP